MYPAITTYHGHFQTPCAELQRRWRCQCPASAEKTPARPSQAAGGGGDRRQVGTRALVRPQLSGARLPNPLRTGGLARNQSVVGDVCATARQHTLRRLLPATAYRVCVLVTNGAGLSRRRACIAFTTGQSPVLVTAGLGSAGGLLLVSTALLYRSLPPGLDATHPTLPHAAAGLPQPPSSCARSPALTSGCSRRHPPPAWRRRSRGLERPVCPVLPQGLRSLGTSMALVGWDPQPRNLCLPFLLLLSVSKSYGSALLGTLCPSASSHYCPVGATSSSHFQ